MLLRLMPCSLCLQLLRTRMLTRLLLLACRRALAAQAKQSDEQHDYAYQFKDYQFHGAGLELDKVAKCRDNGAGYR